MKYTSSQVNQMTWLEWNDTMAKELNEAGFKNQVGQRFNSEIGKWEDKLIPYQADPSRLKGFILGAVDGLEEINYLKQIGLLNNGRCPMCGNTINDNPGRFTSGFDGNTHFQICQNCVHHGRKISINHTHNSGCILALILLPWHILKTLF